MEKMNKRDYFNRILSYAHEEDKAFLLHEIELLNTKNSRRSDKPTKAQAENAVFAEMVLNAMALDEAYTISEIQSKVPELSVLSNQRVTGIVNGLKKAEKVRREVVKGKAYFSKV